MPKNQRTVSAAVGSASKLPCPFCSQRFWRRDILKQHISRVHSGNSNQVYLCGLCPKYFKSRAAVKLHREMNHSSRVGAARGGQDTFQRVATAHRRACEVYRMPMPARIVQTTEASAAAMPQLRRLLHRLLVEKRNARIALVMTVRFRKASDDSEEEDDEGQQRGDNIDGVEGVDVLTVPMSSSFHTMRYFDGRQQQQIGQMMQQIDQALDSFIHNGSGWVVNNVLSFEVQVMQCHSLAGSCTSHAFTKVRKAGMVVQHSKSPESQQMDGERCFFRAVAAALLDQEGNASPTEQQLEEFVHAWICENVPTPVRVDDIDRFEAANEHLNLAINVVYQDDFHSDEIYPCRASPNLTAEHQITLLLFHMAPPKKEGEEEEDGAADPIMHYALVKNLDDILGKGKRSSNGNYYKHNMSVCFNCFLLFHSRDALVLHASWCHLKQGQKMTLPHKGDKVRYDQLNHETFYPWFFVFDFETLNVPASASCSCTPDKKAQCKHKTHVITTQEPFAYALIMVDKQGKICEHIRYLGPDAGEHFVETVLRLELKYADLLENSYMPLVLTPEVRRSFARADVCYLCQQPFNCDAVMDHCHITGEKTIAHHKNNRVFMLSFFTFIFFFQENILVPRTTAAISSAARSRAGWPDSPTISRATTPTSS